MLIEQQQGHALYCTSRIFKLQKAGEHSRQLVLQPSYYVEASCCQCGHYKHLSMRFARLVDDSNETFM